jgi:DNA-binding CsgD family transcriptional regulator
VATARRTGVSGGSICRQLPALGPPYPAASLTSGGRHPVVHLSSTSPGNDRIRTAPHGHRHRGKHSHLQPFPAIACRQLPKWARLDKAEVTGSSPVSPTLRTAGKWSVGVKDGSLVQGRAERESEKVERPDRRRGDRRVNDRRLTDVPANPWLVASFEDSLSPMLLADDRRRFVGVNRAMLLLLRLDRKAVLRMSVDDLTPPESRAGIEEAWEVFIRAGVQTGAWELLMPDGPRLLLEYSATANVEPSRHLSIFALPPAPGVGRARRQPTTRQLSVREREVMARVAMGESGVAIARILDISSATVEAHVRSCLLKLEAKNRAHAIALVFSAVRSP